MVCWNCASPFGTAATAIFWHDAPLCGLVNSCAYWTVESDQDELSVQPLAIIPPIRPLFPLTAAYGLSKPGLTSGTFVAAAAAPATRAAADIRNTAPKSIINYIVSCAGERV